MGGRQLLCTDGSGFFVYVAAIMDWYSRRGLAWRVTNTVAADFCVEALEEAIGRYGAPDISNTNQGTRFTSDAFTGVLGDHGIQISINGKGLWGDNVFVEQLWRSLNYEEVYLMAYATVAEEGQCIANYFRFYNRERRQQGLHRQTPDQVYEGSSEWLAAACVGRIHLSGCSKIEVHFYNAVFL